MWAGHLSYACPKNMLGEREPPKKKEKKKRKKVVEPEEIEEEEESEEEGEDPALDSLSQAIAVQTLEGKMNLEKIRDGKKSAFVVPNGVTLCELFSPPSASSQLLHCSCSCNALGLALRGPRPFSCLLPLGGLIVIWSQLPGFSPHVTVHTLTSKLSHICFIFAMISGFIISYMNC
eukprot:XP_027312891.1 zinc finger CCHC-type and RNA-binding motif-containing protein 1 isoform X9 [Anas platyrhynchos]